VPLGVSSDLAGDLLRQLLPHIGAPKAIEAELQRWIDILGVPRMSLVLLEAVRLTFAECLTYPDQWPTDGIAFHTDRRTPHE
jgi:hypothetical protein